MTNTSPTAAIELRNLSIGYTHGGHTSTVAEQLSARFEIGSLTCLLGSNGVGKSTLLRTIARLQAPLGGSVGLCQDGQTVDISTMSSRHIAQTIGIVLTDRPYAINLTTRQLVAMGRTPYTSVWGSLEATDTEAIDSAMQLTGVDLYAQKPIRSLSDGMLQKAMIAKALAQQTPIILLDEPTAYLDFKAKVDLMRLLLKLAHHAKKTILMSTHDVQIALKLSDRIAVMSNGGITAAPPHEMAARRELKDLVASAGASLNADTLTIDFDMQHS